MRESKVLEDLHRAKCKIRFRVLATEVPTIILHSNTEYIDKTPTPTKLIEMDERARLYGSARS